jgi:hypothetical protein
MYDGRAKVFLRLALLLAPFSLGLAACETLQDLNPLDNDKKTPLSGDRRAVFPQGVPGVQYSAPPTQPTNSNVQLDQQTQNQTPDAQTQEQPQQQPTKQSRTKQARTKQAPANNQNTEDDPWAGQRR